MFNQIPLNIHVHIKLQKFHKSGFTFIVCDMCWFCFISFFLNAGCDSLKSYEAQFEKTLVNIKKIVEQMHRNVNVYYIIKTLRI